MSIELKDPTKRLAIKVIKLTRTIKPGKIEYIVISQLLRSVTSIGANYRAALRGRSRAEFISKLNVAEEEADETCYRLELIMDLNIVPGEFINPIYKEACEITAILTSAGKTAKLQGK